MVSRRTVTNVAGVGESFGRTLDLALELDLDLDLDLREQRGISKIKQLGLLAQRDGPGPGRSPGPGLAPGFRGILLIVVLLGTVSLRR